MAQIRTTTMSAEFRLDEGEQSETLLALVTDGEEVWLNWNGSKLSLSPDGWQELATGARRLREEASRVWRLLGQPAIVTVTDGNTLTVAADAEPFREV